MAQNRKNDDFDLGEFDDLFASSPGEKVSGADGFDFFNFSSADLDAAGIGRVQDDLDLDSFLNFDDLTELEPDPIAEPEPEPVAEPEPELEPEPKPVYEPMEPEEEPELELARRQRRARKEAAFAELFGEKPVEAESAEPESEEPPKAKKRGKKRRRSEPVEPIEELEPIEPAPEDELPEPEVEAEVEPIEPVESFEDEPEYDVTKKRGLFGRRKRERVQPEPEDEPIPEEAEEAEPETEAEPMIEAEPEAEVEPEAEAESAELFEPEAEELAPRKGFFAKLFKPYEPETDEVEPDEPEEAADEKPAIFRSLLSRFKPSAAPEESDEADTDAPQSTSDEEKPTEGKVSFFARLTPEKEKFMALMQAKKEEETSRRRTELVEADNGSLAARIAREPRRNEELVYDSELDELDYIDRDDLPESRDYLPVRFRRYGRSGVGGGLMYAAFVISVSVILACFGWLCAADVLALSKDEVSAVVVVESYVPKDTDTLNEDGEPVDERGDEITCDIDQVATALKEGDIINFKFLFKLFAKLSHASAKIDPGTYDVSTKLDYRALITEMQTGSDSQEITKITFPEGYRMEQVFELLDEYDICDYDDLMETAAYHNYSYSWLDEAWYYEAEGDPRRLEGYLFPDTYEFYQGENAINVINRFLLRFHGLLTQDMYQQAENLGLSLHEAVIVASLIEKEAGADDDRSNFSSAIYNRLNAGWKLQLDSTVNYVNNTSTFSFYYDELETDSPYNTYVYEGLPKGPICSPGLASLNAALQPNSTDYWFWFALDGSTYFFTNEDDFNAFADQYRDY